MSAYSLDLREKIVESVKKGVPKAETARCFGVDRATVKCYCKQLSADVVGECTRAGAIACSQATQLLRASFTICFRGVRWG
jgi:hypothetical protein